MQFRLHQPEQRSKQESKLITNEAKVTKNLNWHMLYDRKYCTCYMIENTAHITAYFQRTEGMIREKDKPCEKT